MPTLVNSIQNLLLDVGMEVEVRGQLVLRANALAVTGYRMLTPTPDSPPTLSWELTPFVSLELAPEQETAYEQLLGGTVYGHGIWVGDAVKLTDLVLDEHWAQRDELDDLPYRKDFTPVSDHIRSVEAGLFASGTLLRRVRLVDDEGLRVVAVATDVEAVLHTLGPVYGDALEVLPSHWEAWQLRQLDDVLNDLSDNKVLKVEFRMNGDGVISRKLRVNHVDAELVRVLGRFPDEMLVVEAVVEPRSAPQHRDVWFPPRPRAEARQMPRTRSPQK